MSLSKQLQQKLEDGNLQDANNDGVVDESDIEAAKEIIKQEKKQKIDFIVENSNDENTTFLSDVIDQSDDQNIGETIEKIIETKDTLVEGVVGNLSDKDNEFIYQAFPHLMRRVKMTGWENNVSMIPRLENKIRYLARNQHMTYLTWDYFTLNFVRQLI